MAGGLSGEWQLNKSVVECNEYLLDTGLASDVSFLVGEETNSVQVKAHKYVLLARSPVFFAMFCGDLYEDTNKPIRIPDVDPDAFKQMLKFLYTDQVTLNSDVVLSTLYSSKKYIVPALAAKCFTFLEKNLNADNVCLIYEQSILFDESALIETCKKFIELRTDEVLKSPTFNLHSQQTIIRLLQFESLAVTELEMFQACCAWSKAECKRQGLDDTSQNQRKVLGDALHLIHFPCLSMKEFTKHVAKMGILNAEEKCAVFEYLAYEHDEKSPNDVQMPFPSHHRQKPDPCVLNRFPVFGKTVVWSGDCSTIQVKVDKQIMIMGIGMPGSLSYDPLSEVQVSLTQEKTELMKITSPVKDDMTGKVVRLMLQQGINCKPGLWYTLQCTTHFCGKNDQGLCRRGHGGERIIVCEGVSFEFDRVDIQTGLIHEIIFSK